MKLAFTPLRRFLSAHGGTMTSLTKGRTRILVLVAVLALPAALVAEVHCPSGGTPPPGSTVTGGLDVDGTCIVDNITVNGGITVEEGGHLQLTSGTDYQRRHRPRGGERRLHHRRCLL